MIPPNITREHVIQAINEIKKSRIPYHRESTKWSILYNGEQFPPKYTVSLANKFASGHELDPLQFSGGDETNNFLRERGFEIVEKTTRARVVKIVTHHENPQKAAELCYEDGVVAIGWTELGDLRGLTREEIMRLSQTKWGRTLQESRSDADQLITFRDKINRGDLVIAYRMNNIVAMIGEIESDYYFDDKNRIGDPNGALGYANQRKVSWWEKPRNFNRSYLPSPLNEKVALPGTILICAEDYDRQHFIEGLKKAGLEVSFHTVSQRTWWIEKTIVRGRPDKQTGDYSLGKALWSPQKDERGADIYKNMRAVKKENVVLHFVDNEAFVGVSIVGRECDASFFVPSGTEWDDGTGKRPGYLITLKGYEHLKTPLDRGDVLQEKYRQQLTKLLDEGRDLFYQRDLNLRQGAYLTTVPAELLSIINEAYKNKTGEDLPYFSEAEPEVEEGKFAILWSANVDLYPGVIGYHQEHIRRVGATYWGVGFPIDTTRIALPLNGYLYTTDSRQVTHIARIQDIETYANPQMPKEANLRPPEYKDELHRTYFKLSKLESLPIPIEIHNFTQRNGQRVVRPPQNYILVMEPEVEVQPLNLQPSIIKTQLSVPENVLAQICANLMSGSHIIVTGPVGTGKTSLAQDVCRASKENRFCKGYVLTTASSDWTTFDTIGGYMPTEEQILVFEEGKFLEAIRDNKWLIIDEINRADIDKAFGQLFTVLSGQSVELPFKYSNGKPVTIQVTGENGSYFDEESAAYKVGRNWRIIATMNVYDMNFLFEMSYAFMRRFAFVYMDVPEKFKELVENWCKEKKLSEKTADKLKKLTNIAERKMGPAIIKDIVNYMEQRGDGERALAEAVVAYILPQLEGLEKDRIEKAWNQIGTIFENGALPNTVIRPILKEIVGIELKEIPESEKA